METFGRATLPACRDTQWPTVSHKQGARWASTCVQAAGLPGPRRVQHACMLSPASSASHPCSCLTPPKPESIASRRTSWRSCYAAARRSLMMSAGGRSQPWSRPPPAPLAAGLGPLAAAWTAPRRETLQDEAYSREEINDRTDASDSRSQRVMRDHHQQLYCRCSDPPPTATPPSPSPPPCDTPRYSC